MTKTDQVETATATAVSATPALRPERDDDEPAFCSMFVAVRRAPMDAAGFDGDTVERLVQHQFDLQRVGYRYTYPLALTEAIVVGGEVVGRLITDDSGDHVVLVDVMVHPALQARGIGTRILRQLINRHPGRAIELRVNHGAPADAWYRKHGFEQVGADALQAHLVRAATSSPPDPITD